jgi:hypothetical protein
MTTKNTNKRLPDFNKMTYEEEAHWWETHDTSEFADEFEKVKMKIAPSALDVPEELRELSRQLVKSNLESAFNIRLTNRDHNKLRIVARQKGVGIATLARMWILEKLRAEHLSATR